MVAADIKSAPVLDSPAKCICTQVFFVKSLALSYGFIFFLPPAPAKNESWDSEELTDHNNRSADLAKCTPKTPKQTLHYPRKCLCIHSSNDKDTNLVNTILKGHIIQIQ